jgi:hypothetical protein
MKVAVTFDGKRVWAKTAKEWYANQKNDLDNDTQRHLLKECLAKISLPLPQMF